MVCIVRKNNVSYIAKFTGQELGKHRGIKLFIGKKVARTKSSKGRRGREMMQSVGVN